MKNGFYKVNFVSNNQTLGKGIAAIVDGRVYGGDSQYLYKGTYSVQPSGTVCKLHIIKHEATGVSIFGKADQFELDLLGGTTQPNSFQVTGFVVGNPSLKITITGQLVTPI